MPRAASKAVEAAPEPEEQQQPEEQVVKAEKGQEFVIVQSPVQQRYLNGRWESVARVEGTKPPVKFVGLANSEEGSWDDLHRKLEKAGFKGKAYDGGTDFTVLSSTAYNMRYFS